MLHDPHPVADLLGQISRSNAGSNSLVEFTGQICPSNCWVKLLAEIKDQIRWSNCGQIAGRNVARYIRNVTRYIRNVARYANARDQMQPIHGPQRASLGARMDAPTDEPKTVRN